MGGTCRFYPVVYGWRTTLWHSLMDTGDCPTPSQGDAPRLQTTESLARRVGGSDENQRVSRAVKIEHPFTAISAACEGHANHNEAQNSALRRRASADRRRQNLYAKRVEGLQRVLDVQRLVHNWVRSHGGVGKKTTPAMAMGDCEHPLSIHELLTSRGFHCLTH